MLVDRSTILSLTALARIAERHVRQHGPTDVDQVIDAVELAVLDRDRATAGVRLAIIGGRLVLDRDATLKLA